MLRTAQRLGWYVGVPLYDLREGRWQQYAFDRTETTLGRRRREWTAVGTTEEACIVEMARCLREISEQ
jgi:hypothetical protein